MAPLEAEPKVLRGGQKMNPAHRSDSFPKRSMWWSPFRSITLVVLIGAAAFLSLTVVELLTSPEPLTPLDMGTELLENSLIAGAMVTMAVIASETRTLRKQHRRLSDRVSKAAAIQETARREMQAVTEDLNHAIVSQLSQWNLSDAESDVALLMLKGFSHKEIARLRGSSSATVRQQASSIYEKSRLPNRSEFVAYFLDAMLTPVDVPAAP
jgi:DNA-binding CsgD family transcriptional regulator